MAEQNPIRYQDLITPDDSIEKLIGQLEELQTAYNSMAKDVREQAVALAEALKKVSGATEQGRKKIKDADSDAKRLEQAYKKLEAALASNAKEIAKLNVIRREANNYNKMLVIRGKEEIDTREKIKNATYEQLSAQYSLNKAYINSLTGIERNTKANKEFIKTTKEIYEQMKKLQADTGKMQLNVGNYPTFEGLLGSAVGISGVAGGIMAAVNALKSGIGTAMDYQQQLSGLAAILGTTTDKIKELAAQSRELGSTTIFTAQEVVQLQTELAKLGYATDDIIRMAPSVLSFAQATGASLADAASLTGAALRMFEKDTTHTTEYVDKMAAATTKSALSFSYLSNALSTCAPVANAFGFELEDVLALLGQLANAGFDASSAATATRNILLNLADSSGKLAKALGEPVTNLDELIKGLKSLNDRGIDLAESLDLTDKRSVAAFNTFLSGTDTVIDLRDEIVRATGAAEDMAKTMGDNLAGSVKTLQSAWQDFMIELNGSQGAISTIVTMLTSLVRAIDKPFKWFNERTNKKRNEAIRRNQLRNLANTNPDDVAPLEATIYKPNEDRTPAGKTEKKTKQLTDKEKKAAEKERKRRERESAQRKREQERQLKEQEKSDKESLTLKRKYEDTMLELVTDANSKEYAAMAYKYEREIEDLKLAMEKKKNAKKLSIEDEKLYNQQIETLEKVKSAKLIELTEKQAKKQQEAEDKKKQKQKQEQQQAIRNQERAIELEYRTAMEGIEQLETSEKEKTRMRLEAEKERLKKLLALYQQDGKKLADEEIKLIQSQINGINQELEKNQKKDRDIYDVFGFKLSDEKKEAIDEALSYSMDALSQWVDGLTAAADKERELADAQVDRAQSVLEKELEARANGYANDVETARKELELAKKNQAKAIEQQKRAQKIQIALDTASQAANLITASSLIWKQLGFPWAIPALAVMWGSFAAAKIKAVQAVGSGDEKYAEGTVELLEGGSHQSGHDIDLGRKPNGTRRRAEGGEFFAVINKRNSRKYRGIIPDVINSLNQGTFAEKYLNAYDGANININANQQSTDLTRLSDDVQAIREQGEKTTYYDGKGNQVVIYKNLKRVVRN